MIKAVNNGIDDDHFLVEGNVEEGLQLAVAVLSDVDGDLLLGTTSIILFFYGRHFVFSWLWRGLVYIVYIGAHTAHHYISHCLCLYISHLTIFGEITGGVE